MGCVTCVPVTTVQCLPLLYLCLQLKLAQAARDGMDKKYQTMTSALKELEGQIKQLLSRQSSSLLVKDEDDDEEGVKVEWLTPTPQGAIQSSLDYAKQLSEKVFRGFQSATVATTYLPGHLKGGATQGYQYALEVYSTLKPVRVLDMKCVIAFTSTAYPLGPNTC